MARAKGTEASAEVDVAVAKVTEAKAELHTANAKVTEANAEKDVAEAKAEVAMAKAAELGVPAAARGALLEKGVPIHVDVAEKALQVAEAKYLEIQKARDRRETEMQHATDTLPHSLAQRHTLYVPVHDPCAQENEKTRNGNGGRLP